jgi:hypothetical protein
MELQQKSNKLLLAGRYFYEDRWEWRIAMEKNTVAVAKYMAKAFIPSVGNYWCLRTSCIAEKCCFPFLIQITTKLCIW